jgi:hypothetical protein
MGGLNFRSLWWMIWMFGIQTIVGVLILYYILGLEMKLGKRWVPLGPILILLGVLVVISAVSILLWNRIVLL